MVRTPLPRAGGLLAGMRIRKKLIVLHTLFSLVLAAMLAAALRPAAREVVREAEVHESSVVLGTVLIDRVPNELDDPADRTAELKHRVELWKRTLGEDVQILAGSAAELGLDKDTANALRGIAEEGRGPFDPSVSVSENGAPRLTAFDAPSGQYVQVSVRLTSARHGVVKLYVLTTIALLSVYGLVAAALEIFVLPRQVYGPIRALLAADEAVQDGRGEHEIIPESMIPRDELGEIMRSRNEAIRMLRKHEDDLASALGQLESAATDLKKKNDLLEMARQNLADSGRLASLGMMSAGLAHEMNTPLAVLKGMVERLHASAGTGLSEPETALMKRVVGRLEKLSDGLLDIARVRPLDTRITAIRTLVDEAWTLVQMDRRGTTTHLVNRLPSDLAAPCDPDRMVQVFVNLLRNAVDATSGRTEPGRAPQITIEGSLVDRDPAAGSGSGNTASSAEAWVSIRIRDNGPGIEPSVLSELFQPFVSTRLDSHGTGLGLAVSEGIIREHGGIIVARNVQSPTTNSRAGAEFEILLPAGDLPNQPPAADLDVDSRAAPRKAVL